MTSDEALYDAYRDRKDEGALRSLVERHWPGVYRLAHAIVRDAPSAEDVAQEALVRVVQAARAQKRLAPFAGWLRTVTVNEARMSLRSKRRRERHEDELAAQADAARAGSNPSPLDPAAAVREYTEALDERLRLPLVLHYGLGLTHAEVGEAIGCPAGTASSRIREGLDEVRAALSKKGTAVDAAAIGLSLGAIGTSSVPPVPSISSLVAKASATQAVGVAAGAGKKLGVAVVAFVLCAGGMGALLVKNLSDEPSAPPRKVALETTKLAPGTETPPQQATPVAPETTAVVTAAPTDSMPVAVPFNGPPPEGGPGGPKRVMFGGPGDEGPRGAPGVAPTPVRTRAKGRVIDQQGNGVPGARVAIAGTGARGDRDVGIRMKRRGFSKATRVRTEPGKGPDFKTIDEEVQRAMAASNKLRGLTELAATTSGPDGSFEVAYDRYPTSQVFVTATVERDGETFGVEKPLPGEDAGDITVARVPAVVVSVTSAGAPVEGAEVHFVDAGGDSNRGTTDAKGLARRATRAPRVMVTVTKPGFATTRADAALASGDSRLEVALVPSATVLGTIRGPDNQPLAGVPVIVEDPESPDVIGEDSPIAKTVSDAQGHFTVEGLAPGRSYELDATPADVNILKGRLTVTAPDNSADLALGRAGSITCDIKVTGNADTRFKEWPGVDVQRQEGGSWAPSFTTERRVEGSRITFGRLAPGTYRVFVHPMMFPKVEGEPVTIPVDGGSVATTITLNAGRTLTGRIVDTAAQPVKRARVLRAEGGMMVALMVGPDGRFELGGVSNERFTFTVTANGYEDQSVTAEPGRNDLGDVMLATKPPEPEKQDGDKPVEKAPQEKPPEDR